MAINHAERLAQMHVRDLNLEQSGSPLGKYFGQGDKSQTAYNAVGDSSATTAVTAMHLNTQTTLRLLGWGF